MYTNSPESGHTNAFMSVLKRTKNDNSPLAHILIFCLSDKGYKSDGTERGPNGQPGF